LLVSTYVAPPFVVMKTCLYINYFHLPDGIFHKEQHLSVLIECKHANHQQNPRQLLLSEVGNPSYTGNSQSVGLLKMTSSKSPDRESVLLRNPKTEPLILKWLLRVSRIFGICPYAIVREKGYQRIELSRFWQSYCALFTLSFFSSSLFLIRRRLNISGFFSPFMLWDLAFITTALAYPIFSLLHGRNLAEVINILYRKNNSHDQRRVDFCCRLQCFFALIPLISYSTKTLYRVVSGERRLVSDGLIWGWFAFPMSVLGQMHFTTSILLITGHLEMLIAEIDNIPVTYLRREPFVKTYTHLYRLAGMLNNSYDFPLLTSVLAAFVDMMMTLFLVLVSKSAPQWQVFRIVMICFMFLRLLVLVQTCEAAHSAVI